MAWDPQQWAAKGNPGGVTGQPRPNQHQGLMDMVSNEAGAASGFAQQSQNQFGQLGRMNLQEMDYLRRLARGENSLSAEQLRQGLQQNVAGQQAMAAGARPGQAPMAARTAAMNAARMGSGLAGQQAMAGIAERNAAQQSLMNAILGQRGQDLQATLGSRGQSLQGYMGLLDDDTRRYLGQLAQPSTSDKVLSALGGGMGFLGTLV